MALCRTALVNLIAVDTIFILESGKLHVCEKQLMRSVSTLTNATVGMTLREKLIT